MTNPVSLNVNGHDFNVQVARDTPLLYVLRNDLQLKGTRFGCGAGQCGACAVLVEGRRQTSCDLPVWAVENKQITTVEGLGGPGHWHPLQQAFIYEQAAQCGYCVSGILMTAAALLQRIPHPTQAQIRTALDDNLCRCGTHNRFVRAILRVAGETVESP